MKAITAVLIAALGCTGAKAELFSPSAMNGAALGGIAGAIIGHNNGGGGWRGAAIGAGSGLLLGSFMDDYAGPRYYRETQVPVPGGYYSNRYVYRPTSFYRPAPVYGYSYGYRPSYAARGTLLGGIAGGIIGHNSRHGGWKGAAVGAGAGLLLGALADAAERNETVTTYEPEYLPTAEPAATQASTPQNVTIINNYYNTPAKPMGSANALFGR
jgi:uncharacterized protein YcfJ